MKFSRALTFVLAGLLGATAGLPIEVQAKDIEIYLGGDTAAAAIKPNALFILDTSGSMSAKDGQAQDRLDRMKSALKLILDDTNNVNVGLMRFTDPGGPILFPVADINANADTLKGAGQSDISVRVSQGIDDAEYTSTAPGAPTFTAPNSAQLIFDNSSLELVKTPGFGEEKSGVFSVTSGADDVEENQSGGAHFVSSEMEIFTDGCCTRSEGLRYTGVNIAQGSTILHSEIEFVARQSDGSNGAPVNGRFYGDDTGNAATWSPGLANPQGVRGRINANPTDKTVLWTNIEEWFTGERYQTPALTTIVQEIVCRGVAPPTDQCPAALIEGGDAWASGNAMAFMLEDAGGTSGIRQARTFEHSGNTTNASNMSVEWVPAANPAREQVVALRFRNVLLPRDASITRAYLELTPVATTTVGDAASKVSMQISAEANDGTPATLKDFSATDHLGAGVRPRTTGVNWVLGDTAPDQWTRNNPVQSPDITTVLKDINTRAGWCGGNDIVIFIEKQALATNVGPRNVYSFDRNPAFAPTLRIDYDEASVTNAPGKGCTVKEITAQVGAVRDDAEQDVANSSLFYASSEMEMFTDSCCTRKNGVRFQNIEIPNGSNIVNARLSFQARQTSAAAAASMTIYGHAHDDSPEFRAGAGIDVLSRFSVKTTASTTWNGSSTPTVDTIRDGAATTGWQKDKRYATNNIGAIMNEIVGRPGWASGNAMTFLLEGTGLRESRTFDDNAAKAAVLEATVQYNMGDVPAAAASPVSVRDRMKEAIDEFDHGGYTPIVDTLMEARRYYVGDDVLFGASRGTGATSVRQNTRLSHPASYKDGVRTNPGNDCLNANLSSLCCIDEVITDAPNAEYLSPITDSCQSNFIVLLTDGEANHNHSETAIKNQLSIGSCQSSLGNGDTINSGERCGIDLVKDMQLNDQVSDSILTGAQIISTYTIGFELANAPHATAYLKDMAAAGGGKFFPASTAQELADVFQSIILEVLAKNTSFAAPALSINAFQKLQSDEDIYFSLFKPEDAVAWKGNIKKFKICQSSADGCTPGDILDSVPSGAIGEDKQIRNTAVSYFNPGTDPFEPTVAVSPDGNDVLKAGLNINIPKYDVRKVYSFVTDLSTTAPSNTQLTTAHEVKDTNDDGALDGLSAGSTQDKQQRTKDLLNFPGRDFATIDADGTLTAAQKTAEKAALIAELAKHIRWIRGKDVDDEDGDGKTNENRFILGDPLHSESRQVTFGAKLDADDDDGDGNTTETLPDAPVKKLMVVTNGGGFHIFNTADLLKPGVDNVNGGKEEFVFMPQSMLALQRTLRENVGGVHADGIDGTPVIWQKDGDNDGLIEPVNGDFIRVFFGMRRGGDEYFALDLTPNAVSFPNGLDDPSAITNLLNPTYMWRQNASSGQFPRLAQTWSRPRVTRILRGDGIANASTTIDALIFSGGYDDTQEGADNFTGPTFVASGLGNSIYVADPLTGNRLISITSSNPLGTSTNVVVPTMLYPIPSDIRLMDSDFDGNTDRLYVGDTGGNVWRVDIDPNLTASVGFKVVVGKLASVSNNLDPADKRKFFNPPAVVQIRAIGNTTTDNYDMVTIVSGNRPHPLNTLVDNRFFALRDYTIGRMADAGGDGIADSYTTIQGKLVNPVTPGDLFDVSTNLNVEDETSLDFAALKAAKGYYITFDDAAGDNGEKGFSTPSVAQNVVNFSTYRPTNVVNVSACGINEGLGREWTINLLNGAPVINYDSPDGQALGLGDRFFELGSGIPSSPVPVFLPEKLIYIIGTGGGAVTLDPGIGLPRFRTYWFEQDS